MEFMDQQNSTQTVLPVGIPVQQSDPLTAYRVDASQQTEQRPPTDNSSGFFGIPLWVLVLIMVVLISLVSIFLWYKLIVSPVVSNSIVMRPQELSSSFYVDAITLSKPGFFVLVLGNDFNAPSIPFYSSPMLPAGEYKDIQIDIGEDNYKNLSSTYKQNTKLFAYLMEDTNGNGSFDNIGDFTMVSGDDMPFLDLKGNYYFIEVLRP